MIDFNAFFKVSYGLYIVSAGNQNTGNGFVSNSVFQVTSEPAQFAACCNKDNYTAKLITEHNCFSISVLHQEASMELIGLFGYNSGKDTNKFEQATIKHGELGTPIVMDGAIAYFECKVVQSIDVGTHIIFVGEVVSTEVLSDQPAMTYEYYRSVKKGMAPKNAPTYIDKEKLDKSDKSEKENIMNDTYRCPVCGYEHNVKDGDPKSGIDPNTSWEDILESYKCPLCGAPKEDFYKL